MTKSIQIQPQESLRLSVPDAVCLSSIPTETTIFEPLSLSEQICAIALIEAYLREMIGGDVHYLAAMQAINRSQQMGVNEEDARVAIATFIKYRKNPMPGFM